MKDITQNTVIRAAMAEIARDADALSILIQNEKVRILEAMETISPVAVKEESPIAICVSDPFVTIPGVPICTYPANGINITVKEGHGLRYLPVTTERVRIVLMLVKD